MFYRPKPIMVNQRPLVARTPWWWEIKYAQLKKFLQQAYEFFLALLLMAHVQLWQEEKFPGQYHLECSFSTEELRSQCLMRENAKLLAVMAKPAAVKNREDTIAMYRSQRDEIARRVTHWLARICEWYYPHSLHAHEMRLARKKIQFFDSVMTDLQNTPRRRAEQRLARLKANTAGASASFSGEEEIRALELDLATDEDCSIEPHERFSARQERMYSSNIDPWFYDEKERTNHLSEIKFLWRDRRDLEMRDMREVAKHLVHPDQAKWLARKLMFCYQGNELEGNQHIVLWFDPMKYSFVYDTNTQRSIDTRVLQAAAMRYVLTYRCLDFYIDDIYLNFFRVTAHPEIRKYFLDEDRKLVPKKKVELPHGGGFKWMNEEDWKNELLLRQGYKNPSKYKLLDYSGESDAANAYARSETYADESGALVVVDRTQEEIDEDILSRCAIVEAAPENPNSVAKNNKQIKNLRAAIPEYTTQVRPRFHRVVDEQDKPRELSLQKCKKHIPRFTNQEFETYALLYHGPGSDRPINSTGYLLLDSDATLNGHANSLQMIEMAYEDATPATITKIGLQRVEAAREEAKQLCIMSGQDEQDYGVMVPKLRVDEKARINSENVEKLRITQAVNLLLQNGAMDSNELLMQIEHLPATMTIESIVDCSERELDPKMSLLLSNGEQNSDYLDVQGYYDDNKTDEEKEKIETRLVELRRDRIAKRLNEVANTSYFIDQVKQNIQMMQSGKYIDKQKEAQRFVRHENSTAFKTAPKNNMTYLEYLQAAKTITAAAATTEAITNGDEDDEEEEEEGSEEEEESSEEDV